MTPIRTDGTDEEEEKKNYGWTRMGKKNKKGV